MKLDILISTFNERVHNVKRVILSPRNDVHYYVTHQYTSDEYKDVPADLNRDDITVTQLNNKGVTISRNTNIRIATGDIGLFSDDDVTYNHSYFDTVITAFRNRPDIDVALFKIKTPEGEPEYKRYPDSVVKLEKLLFSVSTIEMAINLNKIKSSNIKFDERFGVGQELLIGAEESIFVTDCLRKGLNVYCLPEYIVEHPYLSTVNKIPKFDKRRNWVTGAYDCRINGGIAVFKAFGGTIRFWSDMVGYKKNPMAYLFERLSAAIYILRTNKKYR